MPISGHVTTLIQNKGVLIFHAFHSWTSTAFQVIEYDNDYLHRRKKNCAMRNLVNKVWTDAQM